MDLDVHLPAIASGDAGAFARWVAAAEPAVRRSLGRYAARLDVEVVVQETLLRIWQVAPRVAQDGHPNSLLRLALRSAQNLALDELRRSRRWVAADADAVQDELEPVEPVEADPGLRGNIQRCSEKLPHKPGRALAARLASAGGEPDEVLAERLTMQLNTFHQNLARARKLLAECLRRAGIEWGGAMST
jgi:DNA-directed RNA polymerase specialized sigma24 family protein